MTLCKVNNSAAFSPFTALYGHPSHLVPRHFHDLRRRPLCTLAATPFLPAPAAIDLLSVCGFVWTFPVNEPNTMWPLLSGVFHSVSCLQGSSTLQPLAALHSLCCQYPTVRIDGPQLFIRSSVGGHLGCLHLLTFVSGAAMSFCVHVSV